MKWKLLYDKREIDLISYVKSYLATNDNIQIFIGTDSQNRRGTTHFAFVIVLYKEGKGGHVLYSRKVVTRMRDMVERLLKEVEYSINIADELKNSGIDRILTIDLDLNEDKLYKSNKVLTSALGWCKGMGYEVRIKPMALASSYCADRLAKA